MEKRFVIDWPSLSRLQEWLGSQLDQAVVLLHTFIFLCWTKLGWFTERKLYWADQLLILWKRRYFSTIFFGNGLSSLISTNAFLKSFRCSWPVLLCLMSIRMLKCEPLTIYQFIKVSKQRRKLIKIKIYHSRSTVLFARAAAVDSWPGINLCIMITF